MPARSWYGQSIRSASRASKYSLFFSIAVLNGPSSRRTSFIGNGLALMSIDSGTGSACAAAAQAQTLMATVKINVTMDLVVIKGFLVMIESTATDFTAGLSRSH